MPQHFFFLSCFFLANVFASETIQRLDGRVIKVDEEERLLFVAFEHPVSEQVIEKKFKVEDSTGFKRFKKLKDLNQGDLVSIDYLEKENQELSAVYIIYVPIKLAYATPGEVAKALTKIGANQES